ncbi:hypothetical protein D9M68_725070 [compost metagenome]
MSEQTDIQAAAAVVVGQIVFAFSSFETNLSLCIRSAIGGQGSELVVPLLERLNFKAKLDALLEIVQLRFPAEQACLSDFAAWHKEMDKLRARRNSFIHGRWGFLDYQQQVVNVRPGQITSVALPETRYTLDELRHELAEIEQVIARFYKVIEQLRI